MGKWSGAGQPNTRRKLHKFRLAQRLERDATLKAERSESTYYDRSWKRDYRGGDRLIAYWIEEGL